MISINCDFCERPLPVETIDDRGETIEYTKLSHTKEWKTRSIFPHLCPSCAEKIDIVLRKYKEDVPKEMLLAKHYAKLNEQRRSMTGSKG